VIGPYMGLIINNMWQNCHGMEIIPKLGKIQFLRFLDNLSRELKNLTN
jgi:hypothetical protein